MAIGVEGLKRQIKSQWVDCSGCVLESYTLSILNLVVDL
jgi:hypothetical protein